jgi:uncharacterized repeat protein (TIGR03803 family)
MLSMSLQRCCLFAARTISVLFVAVCGLQTAVYAQRLTCSRDTITVTPGCIPVHFFQGGADGGDPVGGVTLGANGALYGTTNGGGVNEGTVYELTPPAKSDGIWGYRLLHSFGSVAGDGINPQGPLVIDKNGAIYGMTTGSSGTVYQLTPPASPGGTWGFSTLHTFTCGSDGCQPWWAGVVLGKNGVLYGTTAYGGSSANGGYGWGTVFELAPPADPGGAWTESVLYSFKGGSDGAYPQASLLYTNGVLYGTAYTGGVAACGSAGTEGCGVVFELKPKAGGKWKESVLHTFTGGNDGGLSSAALIVKNGVLYGTTSQEDSYYDNNGDCNWGCGTVFELAPPASAGGAWTETVLYHFQPAATPPGYSYDGSAPVGGVVFGPNGALYGTTAYGGPFGTGTIFELAPPASPGGAWTESVLYEIEFDSATGGYYGFPTSPFAGLTVGKHGELFGTETSDAGMVFELKP